MVLMGQGLMRGKWGWLEGCGRMGGWTVPYHLHLSVHYFCITAWSGVCYSAHIAISQQCSMVNLLINNKSRNVAAYSYVSNCGMSKS